MKSFTKLGAEKALLISGAAALGLAFAAPAASAADIGNISFNDFNFDIDSENFLQNLIDMDADDIADLRAEMADARAEIKDAIAEIADARKETEEQPEAKAVLAAALQAASASVIESTDSAFKQVHEALDQAESDLVSGKVEVSAEEVTETKLVIATLREELGSVQAVLGELVAAMKA
ncbi:hypothetical protein [Hyphococcus sp.]|uniref:hypothetical protein n=1 Tax=Hyphococcus sp. TaxID=2038636 RepID=UPI0020876643|nr:MAG: hypothetical protein DHS20C04_06250 [Marinicaulis sp.]